MDTNISFGSPLRERIGPGQPAGLRFEEVAPGDAPVTK
jgi:hypothetical protein